MSGRQVYEPEMEFPVPDYPRVPEEDKKSEQGMGDVYDVYGKISKIHSKLTTMNTDYKFANYKSQIYNEKFPKFIREQRKAVRILESYMIVPKETLIKRFNPDFVEIIYSACKKAYVDVEKLLLGEIDEMVTMTVAGAGEVKQAMLMHGRTHEEREEYQEAIGAQTIGQALTEKRK